MEMEKKKTPFKKKNFSKKKKKKNQATNQNEFHSKSWRD